MSEDEITDSILDNVDHDLTNVVREQYEGAEKNVITGVDNDISDNGYKMSDDSPRQNGVNGGNS